MAYGTQVWGRMLDPGSIACSDSDAIQLGCLAHQNAEKVQAIVSSPSASKRVPYHGVLGVWPMADWLTCSAFTHRARVRSRAQKSFFILLSKFMKIFAYPHFYAGNTMALLFFHENFWKMKISKRSIFCAHFMRPFHLKNRKFQNSLYSNIWIFLAENDKLKFFSIFQKFWKNNSAIVFPA